MSVTRERLYEEVWAEPMTTVAGRYEVSSSFLARVCARLNVPRPPRGYWAKTKVGKAPKQPPLPEAAGGHEVEWAPGGGLVVRRSRVLPAPPPKRRRPSRSTLAVDVTEHPLLVNVRPHFEKVYPQSGWSAEYPRPYKKLIPDIVVSGEALGRALEVANALFLAMERGGYQVTLAPTDGYFRRPELDHREQPRGPLPEYGRSGWRPGRPTVVLVGTVAIGLTVYEVSEYVEVERVNDRYVRKDTLPPRKRRASGPSDWVHREDMPSGRLALRAYSPYSGASWQQDWREKAPGELPSYAKAILRALTQAAPVIAASVAEARRQAEIESAARTAQYREYLKAEHARKRLEAQKTSREHLMAAIQHWTMVRGITNFLTDVERQVEALPADQRSAATDRLALARAMIGNTDALNRFLEWKTPDEICPPESDEG